MERDSLCAVYCTCCSCRQFLTSSLLSSNIPLLAQWKPCIPAPFSAYYNPLLISCLLPVSATLHPLITLPLFSPAAQRSHYTTRSSHIKYMPQNVLCHFSEQLGLQMDYSTKESDFLLVVQQRVGLRTGCLVTCLSKRVQHIVFPQLSHDRPEDVELMCNLMLFLWVINEVFLFAVQ